MVVPVGELPATCKWIYTSLMISNDRTVNRDKKLSVNHVELQRKEKWIFREVDLLANPGSRKSSYHNLFGSPNKKVQVSFAHSLLPFAIKTGPANDSFLPFCR